MTADDRDVADAPAAAPWVRFADGALRALAAQGVADDPAGELPDAGRDGQLADAVDDYARARIDLAASLSAGGDGFAAVVANARLTDPEIELLAIVLACELDVRRLRLVATITGASFAGALTMQAAGWLLGSAERAAAALGPNSGLRRAALVDIVGDGPWAQREIVVPISLVWAMLGDTADDPDLPYGAWSIELDDALPAPGAEAPGVDAPLVIAYGPDRVRRRQAAFEKIGGQRFLITPPPVDDTNWAALVREATMTGRAVVVELDDPLAEVGRRWIDRAAHLPWALTAARELTIEQLPMRTAIEVDAPATELTTDEWAAVFGDAPRTHRLTPQQAERARRAFSARGDDIDAAVRRLLAGPLESLATRIRPRSAWDDLVLSPARTDALRSIVSRYRESARVYDEWGFSATPSRGLVALFSGPSGTGKTLAAEVLAGELGLDMFKLDLSSVVSKYIGETEKNLDQVFDAAGVGNVVLFFDEADALFGKRSEVRDARDRYANVEVSYLLQRVEAFDGVVVLATNFEKSIDEAFLRRIHSRIDFVLPEADERLAIWRQHLPQVALADDVDLPWLADRFEFSGGQIRNAAVHAAFRAAEMRTEIGMAELVVGAAQELRKVGRLLRPEMFGEWYPVVTGEAPPG